jgi:hypothetical protein
LHVQLFCGNYDLHNYHITYNGEANGVWTWGVYDSVKQETKFYEGWRNTSDAADTAALDFASAVSTQVGKDFNNQAVGTDLNVALSNIDALPDVFEKLVVGIPLSK